jgi:hypothetical protein
MRFVLCIVIAALLPVSALAAKGGGGTMSLSRAQAAAAKGDQKAAAAVATNRDACMSGCANRGISKNKCVSACRPGLCDPGAEQPYCVSK